MASTHCPACPSQNSPKPLPHLTEHARVNYYRCLDCHHIWTTTKDGQTLVRHITRLPEPTRSEASVSGMQPAADWTHLAQPPKSSEGTDP
jgi:hypothetical protein